MRHCFWLPDLEYYDDRYSEWKEYEDFLYSIFREDFIDTVPLFDNDRVNVKRYPFEFGKEEAFFHTTCQDYSHNGDRVPDFRRCERIRWIRAFIDYHTCDPINCEDCEGIKIWWEDYKGRDRVHLLSEEEKYLVVLEKRTGYYLLITAFYYDRDHSLRKALKRYKAWLESGQQVPGATEK